jgi:predicted TIM-barrel fold metal-dependent hydrolase
LKCFGVHRCIYGTDWPVFEEVDAKFKNVFGFVDRIVSEHIESEGESGDAWNSVFYENALDFYGLI